VKFIRVIFIIIFLSLFFNSISFSQQYWIKQNSPETRWLYRLDFVDSLYGWVCGDSGAMIATTNGGINWFNQQTGINYFIEDIQFIDRQLGYGIANDYYFQGSTILKTTNGGNNWTFSRYPDTTVIINTVYFLNEQTGFLGGFLGIILKTTNAGLQWKRMDIDSAWGCEFPIRKYVFRNSRFGYACGGIMDIGGVVWRTTDYGLNWLCDIITPEPLLDILIVDSLRAITVGGDFEYGFGVAKTYNAGVNWTYNNVAFFGVGQALTARTPDELWVPLGFSGKWAVSLDTGNTWIEIPGPDSAGLYDAEFVSPYSGWACGTFGSIYKYNTGIIGIKDPAIPVIISLSQNYPNPFNPKTTIKFNINKPSNVKLTIYDPLGREVKVVTENYPKAGEYKVEIDMSDFSSGLYFYKITAGSYSKTMKMVLVK
jgi:photosystem II stability/assembly factor-like uncharacterized protein